MASTQSSERTTIAQLMTTVQRLSPSELREFKRQFARWQRHSGGQADEEAVLVQACRACLSAPHERRLSKLITKSERGTLSPKELQDYRKLVLRAEKLDATRLAALTDLARRWGKPVRIVMETIGWEGSGDDTTGHPARPAKAGARSSR